LVAEPCSIGARWRNYFSQLLNICGFSNCRQAELYTAKALVPELRSFEIELSIEKLKSHKLLGIDEIPAELINSH
jgi:hypothetical protein